MFKISFDFDEVTQKVSNLKVESHTASVKEFDMEVEENKLVLTSEAVRKLNAVAGDRLSVNYWTVNNETTYPIISKSDVFTDGASGNKLTGKGTISFKGQQRTSLLNFGNLFKFTEFTDKQGNIRNDVFVLTPIENKKLSDDEVSLKQEKEIVEELNSDRVEDEIDSILGEENFENALPF